MNVFSYKDVIHSESFKKLKLFFKKEILFK